MGGTPRSSMLKGFPIFKQPFWGTPLTWETPNCGCSMVLEDLPPKLGSTMERLLMIGLFKPLLEGDFLAMIPGKNRGHVEVWKCGSVSF